MLARSKLNSIEGKYHEDFMTIINEERNYRELKQSIRMMKGQKSGIECNSIECNSVEEDKK